jgi:protein-L-isoaspartate(D-aspartate) O-methyltransferase
MGLLQFVVSIGVGALVLGWGMAACRSEAWAGEPGWGPALKAVGVTDARIFAAMQKVRRADYLPLEARPFEFEDRPLSIGLGQTTSQPSLIARMVEELDLKPGCRVLEVGTGSGYETALLAELCDDVYSIDIVEALSVRAGEALRRQGYQDVHLRTGDGYLGWPEAGPFDGIVVCAAASELPQPLVDQLKPGGRLVIPVGDRSDGELEVVTKRAGGLLERRRLMGVVFVPLTGPHAERDRRAGRHDAGDGSSSSR